MIAPLPNRIANYKISADSPTSELLTLGQIYAEIGDYTSSILDSAHLSISRLCARRLKKVTDELIKRGAISSHSDLYALPSSASETTDRVPETAARASETADPVDLSQMTIEQLYLLYRQWPLRRLAPESIDHPSQLESSVPESLTAFESSEYEGSEFEGVRQTAFENSEFEDGRQTEFGSRDEERQTDFEERQTDFEERQTNFEERQTDFEERQTAFEERQTAFEERQTEFEGRIVDELARRKPASRDEQLKIDYCTLTYQTQLESLSLPLPL